MEQTPTIRQSVFLTQVALGKTYSDAGRIAGYSPNNTDKILKTTRMKALLSQLRERIESKTELGVATIADRQKALSEIINVPLKKDEVTPTHRSQAVDILNKMDRIYLENTPRESETYNTFVLVLPDGTKITPAIEGESRLLEEKDGQEGTGTVTDAEDA